MSINFRLHKLNFHVEYLGRIRSTEIQPYKTIDYLIGIVKNLFYPIKSKIKILYNQTDIIPYNKYLIGDFFKLKTNIYLKIVSQYYNSNHNNIQNIQDINKPQNINTTFICLCGRNLPVTFYCRNEKVFICNYCKFNLNHEKHRTIKVDTNNYEDTIKLYCNTLIKEIKINIEKTQNYTEKMEKGEYDINQKHNEIKEKLNKLYEIYNSILNNIKRKKNINQILEKYKSKTKITNEEIEEILETIYKKYTRKKKKMNSDEFKSFFNEISHKDELLEIQNVDLYALRVEYEFNEKMKNIYDKIDEVIQKTVNDNNVLNVSKYTNHLFSLIIEKEEENKKNEENENEDSKENDNDDENKGENNYEENVEKDN